MLWLGAKCPAGISVRRGDDRRKRRTTRGNEGKTAPRALECLIDAVHHPRVDCCFRVAAHVLDQELRRAQCAKPRRPAPAHAADAKSTRFPEVILSRLPF